MSSNRKRSSKDAVAAEFVALAGRLDTDLLLKTFAQQKLHIEARQALLRSIYWAHAFAQVHDRTRAKVENADGKHVFGQDPGDEAKLIAIGSAL